MGKGKKTGKILFSIAAFAIGYNNPAMFGISSSAGYSFAAGLIMKQMEETAKQPTMVNINALDSKSFAEYLNENSDILAAILAKNKAMNR